MQLLNTLPHHWDVEAIEGVLVEEMNRCYVMQMTANLLSSCILKLWQIHSLDV